MKRFILPLIIALAFFLRVFAIDVIPFGFTPDEASFGYDAYSILKTGKDQWGHKLPLVLESFGDFKPPLYSYLSIPFIAIFGLSKYSVRLVNSILGTLAVYITFLLVNELFVNFTNVSRKPKIFNQSLSLLTAFLLSISPWHVMLSRGAFESNLTTFLLPLGLFYFLKGLRKSKYLIASAFIFGLNLFSYHSARLVTPIFFIFLIFIFRNDFKRIVKKAKLTFVAIFFVFLIAAFYTLFIGGATRAKDISIFSGALQKASEDRIVAIYQGLDEFPGRLLHNKYQVILERFFTNYLEYFSVDFLFVNGPSEATYGMLPGRGALYWFELPFLIAFIYKFFNSKVKKPLFLILFWLLVAPIPAALTSGKGFAGNRSAVMIPAIQIASGLGAYTIVSFFSNLIKNKIIFRVFLSFYMFTILFFFLYFLEDYFLLSPVKSAKQMLYGNLEAAYWLRDNSFGKTEIIMSTKLSEPHIYVAFSNKWDPVDYQKNSVKWSVYKDKKLLFVDQLPEYRLGKYTFRAINYKLDQYLSDSYLVGKPEEFDSQAKVVKQLIYPNNQPAVLIVAPGKEGYAFKGL